MPRVSDPRAAALLQPRPTSPRLISGLYDPTARQGRAGRQLPDPRRLDATGALARLRHLPRRALPRGATITCSASSTRPRALPDRRPDHRVARRRALDGREPPLLVHGQGRLPELRDRQLHARTLNRRRRSQRAAEQNRLGLGAHEKVTERYRQYRTQILSADPGQPGGRASSSRTYEERHAASARASASTWSCAPSAPM